MQNYTSKNTSVNTTRVPAIYNKVRWDKLPEGVRVLDWGCGKDTTLTNGMLEKHGLVHVGYDPNWKSEVENMAAISLLGIVDAFVCSNVLNVIDDDDIVRDICRKASQHKYFFITVYEGDKSGVGKRSKEDCYQRNAKIKSYMQYFTDQAIHDGLYVKNGVLTNSLKMIKEK
jgi:hypothetical protein